MANISIININLQWCYYSKLLLILLCLIEIFLIKYDISEQMFFSIQDQFYISTKNCVACYTTCSRLIDHD